jgi:hypothetical protein
MLTQYASRSSRGQFVRLLLFLAFVPQLTACRKPTAQDLVGTWQVDYGTSKLTLTLRQDGTFEQRYQKRGESNLIRRDGKWELAEFEGPSVLLNGPLIVRDSDGTIESDDGKGGWVIHINKTFGHLGLAVNEDLGLYFEKQGQ